MASSLRFPTEFTSTRRRDSSLPSPTSPCPAAGPGLEAPRPHPLSDPLSSPSCSPGLTVAQGRPLTPTSAGVARSGPRTLSATRAHLPPAHATVAVGTGDLSSVTVRTGPLRALACSPPGPHAQARRVFAEGQRAPAGSPLGACVPAGPSRPPAPLLPLALPTSGARVAAARVRVRVRTGLSGHVPYAGTAPLPEERPSFPSCPQLSPRVFKVRRPAVSTTRD